MRNIVALICGICKQKNRPQTEAAFIIVGVDPAILFQVLVQNLLVSAVGADVF